MLANEAGGQGRVEHRDTPNSCARDNNQKVAVHKASRASLVSGGWLYKDHILPIDTKVTPDVLSAVEAPPA